MNQSSKIQAAERHVKLLNPSLFEKVFSVPHLPNYLFVLASPLTISTVQQKASLPLPKLIPRNEWGNSFDSIPWFRQHRHIPAKSWVKIVDAVAGRGRLGYVVGSSNETQQILVAVVPRLKKFDRSSRRIADGVSAAEIGRRDIDRGLNADIAALQTQLREMGPDGPRRLTRVIDDNGPLALFESESVGNARAILYPLVEGHSLALYLADMFKRATISADRGSVETLELDFESFQWAFKARETHRLCQYKARIYLQGLLLVPIFASRAVELVTLPTINELTYFVESGINPTDIDRLFSRLHWKRGDTLSYRDQVYFLVEVKFEDLIATCTKRGAASGYGVDSTEVLDLFNLPLGDVRRLFRAGDGVEVIAGEFKGRNGMVVEANLHNVSILSTTDGSTVVKSFRSVNIFQQLIFCIFILDTCVVPPARHFAQSIYAS